MLLIQTKFLVVYRSYYHHMNQRRKCKIKLLTSKIQIQFFNFSNYRYFGHGYGALLGVVCFCFLFIHEYKLNSEDEVMIMPKIWYPFLFMVPGSVAIVVKKILQNLEQGPLESNPVFFLVPVIIIFTIHGVIIPISMISRSKKCKKFVLKKLLIPFIVCRNNK